MSGDWRAWRPAIWLAMLGVAVMLVLNPPYIGAIFIGGAIGAAIRVRQRTRRAAAAAGKDQKRRQRSRNHDRGRPS